MTPPLVQSPPRRSGWFGWRRLLLAGLCALLGVASVKVSLAQALVTTDAALAYRLAPGNGVIAARLANEQYLAASTAAARRAAVRIAQRALREDATAADALTVLGIDAQLSGNTVRSREVFSYSLALSRRELRPRLWAIEEAVSRGDIRGALRSYDIALRTAPEAPGLLFPVLNAALAEPLVRTELRRIFASNPVWEKDFLNAAARSTGTPLGAATFFAEGAGALDLDAGMRAEMVNSLARAGEFDRAWRMFAATRPGSSMDRLRDPRFALTDEIRTVFDWQLGEEPNLSVAMGGEGAKGQLSFALPAGVGGVIARQTQLLPPGRYRMEGRSSEIDQHSTALPFWKLTCADGRELGRVAVTSSDTEGAAFRGGFTVPADCPVQQLELVARPSDAVGGVSGVIEAVTVSPEVSR